MNSLIDVVFAHAVSACTWQIPLLHVLDLVPTPPEKIKSGSFTLKTVHITWEEFKNAPITGQFEIVFEENSIREIPWLSGAFVLVKLRFKNVLRSFEQCAQLKRFHAQAPVRRGGGGVVVLPYLIYTRTWHWTVYGVLASPSWKVYTILLPSVRVSFFSKPATKACDRTANVKQNGSFPNHFLFDLLLQKSPFHRCNDGTLLR